MSYIEKSNSDNSVVRMLVVQDDKSTAEALRSFFERKNFDVTVATNGDEALNHIKEAPWYDIVLLDLMLQKKSGFEVLAATRRMNSRCPVLMLTSEGEQDYVVKGLEMGADDYLIQPFSFDLVAAHVRAILRRTSRRNGASA